MGFNQGFGRRTTADIQQDLDRERATRDTAPQGSSDERTANLWAEIFQRELDASSD